MEFTALHEKVIGSSQPVLDLYGCELVELVIRREGGRLVVRFLIDHPLGVTLELCVKINKQLSALFDQTDIFPERYFLEVCSPGIDRCLTTNSDFSKMRGKRLKVITFEPFERSNVNVGVLVQVTDNAITLELDTQKIIEIPREKIKKAQKELQW